MFFFETQALCILGIDVWIKEDLHRQNLEDQTYIHNQLAV